MRTGGVEHGDEAGKLALVIGASGALGRAICLRLAAAGHDLLLSYRSNEAAVRALQGELAISVHLRAVRMDLCDAASVEEGLGEVLGESGLDVLVFASGASIEQPFVSQISQTQWRDVIETELMGYTRVVSAALPALRRRQGCIVALTTFATRHYPPGDAISAVPKAGIDMLTRAIAREEGRFGVRANCVAPGIINAGLGKALQETCFEPAVWEAQQGRVPLRRFGEADEVAQAVAFLASGQAAYITGQSLTVDGGLSL